MSELIKTPVRYFADYILVDATGRSVCTFFDYAGVDNPRVREYIALCINDHERLVAEVERLKADLAKAVEERWVNWVEE